MPNASERQIVGERSVSPAAAFVEDAPAPLPALEPFDAFAASSPTPKYSRSGERPGGRATRSPWTRNSHTRPMASVSSASGISATNRQRSHAVRMVFHDCRYSRSTGIAGRPS